MIDKLFITRRTGSPLTLEEWLRYAKTRKDIEIPNIVLAIGSSFKKETYRNPGYSKWTMSDKDGNRKICGLQFKKDSVIVSNPTYEEIELLKQMAMDLSAELISDEGEKY